MFYAPDNCWVGLGSGAGLRPAKRNGGTHQDKLLRRQAGICTVFRPGNMCETCDRRSVQDLSGLKTQRSQNTSVSEHKLIDRPTFLNKGFGNRRAPAA